MLSKNLPKIASLLVSEPFMLDPNFQRSVVLLCEHDDDSGTVGYVLNQPSKLMLADVLDDLSHNDFQLYIGGPVAPESIHFIHKCHDRLNSGIDLGNGTYWGGNYEALKLLVQQKQIKPNEIRFFLGYSGWTSGQLEKELQENAWMVSNQYQPDIIFVENEENLWREAVVNLGPKYAHVANFSQNPLWN